MSAIPGGGSINFRPAIPGSFFINHAVQQSKPTGPIRGNYYANMGVTQPQPPTGFPGIFYPFQDMPTWLNGLKGQFVPDNSNPKIALPAIAGGGTDSNKTLLSYTMKQFELPIGGLPNGGNQITALMQSQTPSNPGQDSGQNSGRNPGENTGPNTGTNSSGTFGSGTKLRKRLMVNCDGTGQSEYTLEGKDVDGKKSFSSPTVSNVARIGRATVMDDEMNGFEQVVYYQMGVGADDELGAGGSKGISGKLTESITGGDQALYGLGVLSNIRNAYGFICNNYDYGDEIYITGFSRGAWTARSIAGLIGRCGILTKRGLEKFFECWYYYRHFWDDQKIDLPVSESKKETRIYLPGTEPRQRIKIRAVGVWDTVGALNSNSETKSVDWRFHDVTLGDHIENAYQAMALNEHRAPFDCTLWETSTRKTVQNFEQCWMVGDHSNIGGSWDDQQLSDITLAWMMSRFENLGVKFDPVYLYHQYRVTKDYFLTKTSKEKNPYPPDMTPRMWGEGRTHNILEEGWTGPLQGPHLERTPGEYCQPVWNRDGRGDVRDKGAWLRNTNETIHPAVRYRRWCQNQPHLGYQDKEAYDPVWFSQKKFAYPRKQTDGRLGQPDVTTGPDPLVYTFTRYGVGYTKGRTLASLGKEVDMLDQPEFRQEFTFSESTMGKWELIYLAFYAVDQDYSSQNNARGNIWSLVLGGNGPTQDILTWVSAIKYEYDKVANANTNGQTGALATPAPNIYIGKSLALADDIQSWTPWLAQANDIKIDSYVGDTTAVSQSPDPSFVAFTGLDRMDCGQPVMRIRAFWSDQCQGIKGINVYYGHSSPQQEVALDSIGNTGGSTGSPNMQFEIQGSERIIKFSIAARVPPGGTTTDWGRSRVVALWLQTDQGRTWCTTDSADVWKVSEVANLVAPLDGWFLKGFYGAQTRSYVARLGVIWGHT